MSELSGRVALVGGTTPELTRVIEARLKSASATVETSNSAEITDWTEACANIAKAHGRFDILVIVALADTPAPRTIADMTFADFKKASTLNIEAAFLGLQAGIAAMRGLERGGAVILVTSALGTDPAPGHAALAASANGIRMMTKAAALACTDAKDGTRINAVLADPAAQPHDIAETVAFLASDRASYITGTALPVGAQVLAG